MKLILIISLVCHLSSASIICYPTNDCIDVYVHDMAHQLIQMTHYTGRYMNDINNDVRQLEWLFHLPEGTVPTHVTPMPLIQCSIKYEYDNDTMARFRTKIHDVYMITSNVGLISTLLTADFTSVITRFNVIRNILLANVSTNIDNNLATVLQSVAASMSSSNVVRTSTTTTCYHPGDCVDVEMSRSDLMLMALKNIVVDYNLNIAYNIRDLYAKFNLSFPILPIVMVDPPPNCISDGDYIYDLKVQNARHIAWTTRRIQAILRSRLIYTHSLLQTLTIYIRHHPNNSSTPSTVRRQQNTLS